MFPLDQYFWALALEQHRARQFLAQVAMRVAPHHQDLQKLLLHSPAVNLQMLHNPACEIAPLQLVQLPTFARYPVAQEIASTPRCRRLPLRAACVNPTRSSQQILMAPIQSNNSIRLLHARVRRFAQPFQQVRQRVVGFQTNQRMLHQAKEIPPMAKNFAEHP